MHINLNNTADHFLQLSPMLNGGDPAAPSPMLSPDMLFLMPNSQPEYPEFHLECNHDDDQEELMGASIIGDLSPPVPYPSPIDPLEDSQLSSSQLFERAEEPVRLVRKRKESRTSKVVQPVPEELRPLKLPSKELSPIRAIIQFLVENSSQPQRELKEQARSLWGEGGDLAAVFASLVGKFKKLRKTKQEMTKYCMRRVFKFIADRMRRDRTHNRDVDSCMKLYFARAQTGASFSIPFKKNSVEKTMNGNFLKRVFASPAFTSDYNDFLQEFDPLMSEDNDKKIIYLSEVMEKCVRCNELKKMQTIKRLPWTREILMQTEQLAVSLLSYSERREGGRDQ